MDVNKEHIDNDKRVSSKIATLKALKPSDLSKFFL